MQNYAKACFLEKDFWFDDIRFSFPLFNYNDVLITEMPQKQLKHKIRQKNENFEFEIFSS